MGTFDLALGQAAAAAVTLLDGESVTYTPNGGAARSISALIEREVPVELPSGTLAPGARLTVRNDATAGIDASSIDTGGDTVTWAPKKGGTSRTSRLLRIAHADGGTVIVEVA